MKKKKNKFIKISKLILTVFAIVAVLSTSIIPTYAYSGISYGGNYTYTGNNDVSVSLVCFDTYNVSSFDVSTSLNPVISYDMVNGYDISASSANYLVFGSAQEVNVYPSFDSFECSENYFASAFVSNNSWFASTFSLSYSAYYFVDSCNVNSIKISARDFYYYLDPNFEIEDSSYDDLYAESFIYLDYKSMYTGAEGTMYYCLAGQEDNANNRQVYNYSYSNEEISSSSSFPMLPEQSLSGTYTEPTLIYIEYLEFIISLNTSYSYDLNGFELTGVYGNYNMDYRNIDIKSYVEPVTPISPGIFADYTSWLGTAVSGFLDFQIVEGFTLGGVVMVLIAFMLCLWFLKVFAGG